MSYEEYWEKECELTESYRKAFEIKQELENQKLWLQGLYNNKAFGVVIANAFGGNKGKNEKYFESPIAITEEEQKAKKQRDVQKTLDWVMKGQQ